MMIKGRIGKFAAAALALTLWPNAGAAQPAADDYLDEVDMFVMDLFNSLQPLSFQNDREYCGYVGFDVAGRLVATEPTYGERDSCDAPAAPATWEVFASYHTHGAYSPDADAEVPSAGDLEADFDDGVDGYIATPGGRLWFVSLEEEVAYTLCGPGCLISDPDYRPCSALPADDEYTLEDLYLRDAVDPGHC